MKPPAMHSESTLGSYHNKITAGVKVLSETIVAAGSLSVVRQMVQEPDEFLSTSPITQIA
jgi:hypothetical protein